MNMQVGAKDDQMVHLSLFNFFAAFAVHHLQVMITWLHLSES